MSHLDHLYSGNAPEEGETINPIYHTRPNQRREKFRINCEPSPGRYLYRKSISAWGPLLIDTSDSESTPEGFTDEELILMLHDALSRRLQSEEKYSKRYKVLERVTGNLSNAGHDLYLMRREEKQIQACKEAKKKSV